MLNLQELKARILEETDWQSRSLDIELFHTQLMLMSKKKWSVRKTAKVLNLCASTVCEDLQLSKWSIKDSNLGRIRRRCDALKYLRRIK